MVGTMSPIIRYLQGWTKRFAADKDLRRILAKPYIEELLPRNPDSWHRSLQDPSEYYLNCVRYFHQGADESLRRHREYFKSHQRGFGEDAFHVMWDGLCRVLRPTSFLEIGVYRGQVISLVALSARKLGLICEICGVSPFSHLGDSVSRYSRSVDYWQDTIANFRAFGLTPPWLIQGESSQVRVVQEFSTRSWDLIYIDGNHEYEAVTQDFANCTRVLNPSGKIVLDDSALESSYQPPLFATSGHPGPSRFASEIRSMGYREVLCVGHNRVFEKLP